MKVSVDHSTLLLLSSETRMEILNSLVDRRKTLTELAKEVGLSKSSVKEHLEKLEKAKLVKRVDEGRKWIYYEITPEGRKIVSPTMKERPSVTFLASIASFISGMILLVTSFMSTFRVQKALTAKPVPEAVPKKAVVPTTPAPAPAATPTPVPVPTATPAPTPVPTPTSTPVATPSPLQTPAVEVSKGIGVIQPAEIMFYVSVALIVLSFILLIFHSGKK